MTTSPFFSLESDTLGTLRLSGAISFANAARALSQSPQLLRNGKPLELDLSALENADSATLAVLIAWSAQAHRQGSALRFLRAPQGLRNLAHLCDVEDLLGLS